MKRYLNNTTIHFCIIFVAILALYNFIINNWFLGDDFLLIRYLLNNNATDVAWEKVWAEFVSKDTIWHTGPGQTNYRPIFFMSFAIEFYLFGINPVVSHLTNIIFHIANSLLVYCIAIKILGKKHHSSTIMAFFSSFIFAIHPLHAEAVTWITGRSSLIATFFYLTAFLAYIEFRISSKKTYLIISIVSLILSLSTKEIGVSFPVLAVAYDLYYYRRKSLYPSYSWHIPWLLLAGTLVAYFLWRKYLLGTFVGGYPDSFSINYMRLKDIFIKFLPYFTLPVNRFMLRPATFLYKFLFVASSISLLSIITCGILRILKDKDKIYLFLFTFVWFIITLIPIYSLFHFHDALYGSRLYYLPTAAQSIGLGVLAGSLLTPPWRDKFFRSIVGISGSISLLFIYAVLLYINNIPWFDAADLSKQFRDEGIRLVTTRGKGIKNDNLLHSFRGVTLFNNTYPTSLLKPFTPFGALPEEKVAAFVEVYLKKIEIVDEFAEKNTILYKASNADLIDGIRHVYGPSPLFKSSAQITSTQYDYIIMKALFTKESSSEIAFIWIENNNTVSYARIKVHNDGELHSYAIPLSVENPTWYNAKQIKEIMLAPFGYELVEGRIDQFAIVSATGK